MEDEYGIKDILLKYGAEGALNDITSQLDMVCGSYLRDREHFRKEAFTEIKCYLLQALISTESNNQLKQEIENIIDVI